MLNPTYAMGRLLTKLDKALTDSNRIGSFKLKYKIATLPPGQAAKADSMVYDPITRIFSAVIKISDSAVKNGTDIFISQSIFHETVHAYLSFLLKRIMAGATYAQIQSLGYPKMFDTYVDSLIGRNYSYFQALDTSAQFQHNYMANKLLEFFANALEEFDDDRINNDEYYWYMAWKGLQQSQPWLHFWPSYNTQNWQTIANPATNNNDKRGFKYALTEDRLININNAIYEEGMGGQDALGKKPGAPGSNICYQ